MTLATTLHPAHADAPDAALPIVLLHGLGGTQYVWSPIVEQLTRAGSVLTIDLPGFGRSPSPREPWSIEGAAREVSTALDELGIERFVLVGHSLGGAVAITLALEEPVRVAALALVAPAGFVGDGDGMVLRAAGHAHAIWRSLVPVVGGPLLRIDAIHDRVFSSLVHDPSVIDAASARELARGAAHGRSTIEARAAILACNLLERCRELAMPTCVVWGRADRVTSVRMAPELEQRIPDVHVELLDEVGHMPQWERPEVVIDAIRALAATTQHA